uniref:Vitamin B12 transporter n=1 Tax=Candidatus Kentrum sp. FW TaxID=2126338 RepID=A0A450TJV2_9GAMM|nr:MAG: vitamin B12 transporter [Candidatus Kentron sp. FW]
MKKYSMAIPLLLLLLPWGAPFVFATELDPIIVTATRTPRAPANTLAPVTVLTRFDIEEAQTDSVPELLAGLPGIDMTRNGGPGTTASIYMRGTNSGHVLVLVNGRKMGSATLGTFPWENLPVSQIERIEIVRGPRSGLYGSEAIGGVVQIFTRERMEGLNVDMELGSGSWDSRRAAFAVSGGGKNTNASFTLAHYRTHGYNVKQHSNTSSALNDPDDDGHRNLSLSLKLGHTFANGIQVEGDFFRARTRSEFDATSTRATSDNTESVQQSLGLKATGAPSERWKLTVAGGLSRDDSKTFTLKDLDDIFNTHRRSASIQNDFRIITDHTFTLGADYLEEQISGTSAYAVSERYDRALFTQYQGSYGRIDWVAGLRAGENEQFGNHLTGNLEFGHRLSEEVRILAGYGTAFKAPTFNDLYYPATAYGAGNPNLQPEESESYEVGLERRDNHSNWSARAFHTKIKGLIDWTPSANNPWFWTPTNIGRALIRGVELEANTKISRFDLGGAFTWMDPENETDRTLLARRARTTFKGSLGYRFARIPAHLTGTLLLQSARYNDAKNEHRVPGYGTINLAATYDISDAWEARLVANNLFNRRYKTAMATATPYDAPGRYVFFSLIWRYSR